MHLRVLIAAFLLMLILFTGLSPAAAQSLNVRADAATLTLRPSGLRLLAGEPLRRLHDGATVRYVFEVTVRDASRVLARHTFRFAVSYDLWEERYTVTRQEPMPRSASNLSLAAAEAWCLDSLTVDGRGLPGAEPLWIDLDYRAEERDTAADAGNDSSFTLERLIDIFGRRDREQEVRGRVSAGPVRLAPVRGQ